MGLLYGFGLVLMIFPLILGGFLLGHIGGFGLMKTLLTVGAYVILPPLAAQYLLLSAHGKATLKAFDDHDELTGHKKTLLAFFLSVIALYIWFSINPPVTWTGEPLDAAFKARGPGGPRLNSVMMDLALIGYGAIFVPLIWTVAGVVLDKIGWLHTMLGVDPAPDRAAADPAAYWRQQYEQLKASQESAAMPPEGHEGQQQTPPKGFEYDPERFRRK